MIIYLCNEMRTLTIVFSILLFTAGNVCNAQTDTLSRKNDHKWILTVSAGAAIPFGKFARFETEKYAEDQSTQDKPLNKAGPALTGFNGKLDLTFMIAKTVGFTCMFYTTSNPATAPDSSDIFPPPDWPPADAGNVIQSYNYTVKKWYTNSLLIGPVFVLDYNKVKFNIKIAGGIQQVQCPETTLEEHGYLLISDSTKPYTINTSQPKLISYNFAFGLGTDVHYFFTKRFGILFSVDMLTSLAHFIGTSSYKYEVSDGINTKGSEGTQSIDFYKYVSFFNINAGICYTFK
jgi:hypothetical protein